jgi:hypothetical protein
MMCRRLVVLALAVARSDRLMGSVRRPCVMTMRTTIFAAVSGMSTSASHWKRGADASKTPTVYRVAAIGEEA